MLDKNIKIFGALLLLTLAACSKEEKKSARPVPQQDTAPIAPVVQEQKEKPLYVYSGDRFRDPFLQSGSAANYQPDAIFDPQRATVTGIIFGSDYRSAVLNVGGGGTYFVKSGKIFDIMGKFVEGFTAKVFVDKVVISGEADNVFELKIRNDEQEAKQS